ncbi:protein of unknown function [Paenibacillus sp. OV219]|nr:protein of unknown function [Paenibacillus sp. OV219]
MIGLLVSVLLFIGIGYMLVKPETKDYQPFLSFSPDSDGIKAIVELAQERGVTTRRWELPPESLPSGSGYTLLIVQPSMLAKPELDAMRSWVEHGNDVLLAASDMEAWDSFQLKEAEQPKGLGSKPANVHMQGKVLSLEATVSTTSRLVAQRELETIYEDERGILGARKHFGEGSFTVLLEPKWLMNSMIIERGHFELVWPLLQDTRRQWLIDEYHHGYTAERGLSAVYPAWLLAAAAQLAIVLLLWLWKRAKRIGPVHTPRAWTVRRGDETLLAVAGWYERRRLRSDALAHSAQRLRQLLYERWGVLPSAPPQEAASIASTRWDAKRAESLLRLLREPQQAQVSAREFAALAREYSEAIVDMEKE